MLLEKEQLISVFDNCNKDVIVAAATFRVSVQTVMASLEKFGLSYEKPKHIYSDLKARDFSSFQKSILIGSILGDGCLEKKKRLKNAMFREEHAIDQEGWLKWKHSNLRPFTTASTWVRDRGRRAMFPDGHGGKKEFSIQKTISMSTITHPYLTYLYESFYVDGVKAVPKDLLLKDFDMVSLATLYGDDASFSSGEIIFCTDSFCLNDVEFLVELLSRFFKGKVGIRKSGSGKYRIKFSSLTKDIEFFTTIRNIVPKCMHYKIPQFSTNTKRLLIIKE